MKILSVSQLEDVTNTAIIGGKARGLLTLSKAGYLIPTTRIVVLGELFDFWESSNKAKLGEMHSLMAAIRQCFQYIGTETIILRSSCDVEDGTECSFAGIFNSVILKHTQTVSDDLLLAELVDMISVPATSSYKHYCEANRITTIPNFFSILVQPYYRVSLSGVMFTQNSIDRQLSEVVIEFVAGNNDCITAGTIIPACIIIDVERKSVTHFDPGATNLELTTHLKKLLMSLAKSGKHFEHYTNAAQDIEWVYADGSFVYLQARPITA